MQLIKRLPRIVLLSVLTLACVSVMAEEPREALVETTAEQLAESKGYRIVKAVKSVRQYGNQSWQYINDKALILEISPTRKYLVELTIPCRGLKFSNGIATTTTGTELTTFDSVLARDSGMGRNGCPIQHLYQLEKIEL